MARALNPHTESDRLRLQRQLIEALLDPGHYPHPAKTVRLIETHISWVLLAGRYAYKIKKALDLGFLDATALSARQKYCREEQRLNRRLAPRLYLDVTPIGGDISRPVLGAEPAIEYAVKMRRFASNQTLDHLIGRAKVTASHLDALADMLARFHTALPPDTTHSSMDFTAGVHAALVQNHTQLAELLDETISLAALRQASEHSYAALQQHIRERHARGYVRECHGDLHLGNIALIAGSAVPFDGIDFAPALRWIDVMDETAFLFMDLLHHHQPALAYRFLNRYLEQTGDYAGLLLLPFYCSYRATVRAKVHAIRADQARLTPRAKRLALATCRTYLSLASELLVARPPRLIITHGLPGSGKSRFALMATEHLGAIRLRSDVERKRLFGLSAQESSAPAQDIYSADATQRTYARLLESARILLNAGYTVIVDAAFPKQEERKMFRDLAHEIGAAFAIVSLRADDATLRARILQRQHLANDASEAGLGVLEKLRAAWETLSPLESELSLIVDPAMPEDSICNALARMLGET